MRLALFITIVLVCSSAVYATPHIGGVSGTLDHGETITISGSGFGVKSPVEPLLWDNFEDGVAGFMTNHPETPAADRYTHRPHGPSMYNDGSFDLNGPNVHLSAHSGKLFLHNRHQAAQAPTYPDHHIGGFNAAVFPLPELVDELFISYYWRFDQYPGLTNYMQMKQSRIVSSQSGGFYTGPGRFMSSSFFYYTGYDGELVSYGLTHIIIDELYAGPSYHLAHPPKPEPGQWQRVEVYKKDSSPGMNDGIVWSTAGGVVALDLDGVMTREQDSTWMMSDVNLGMMMNTCQSPARLTSTSVEDGGSGYVVGDVLTLLGGDDRDPKATLIVEEADASGSIISVSISSTGWYRVTGTIPRPQSPNEPVGGSGQGARVHELSWLLQDCDVMQSVDDFYIDTTRARVELGNAYSWNETSRREIQIPHTTWVDDELVVNVNLGAFSQEDVDEGLFLFVVDAQGAASEGFPVTLSEVPPHVPGDLNGDELVTLEDLFMVESLRDLVLVGKYLLV